MTDYDKIEKVLRYAQEHSLEQPGLAELARVAGLSQSRFHRLFVRWAGTTPKGFLKHLTSARAKRLLAERRGVLDASLEAGLSGPGRLHDLLVTVEGVTPGEFKARGEGLEIRWGLHPTPFGEALLAQTPRGVCHLAFVGGPSGRKAAVRELARRWPKAALLRDQKATAKTAGRVFGRGRRRLGVHLAGTPFQVKVWEALLRVPEGRTASYAQVAAAIGAPKASRAVGSAIGRNAIGYLIPCHRVIRGLGALGGYRWGPERKRALLAWEAARAGR